MSELERLKMENNTLKLALLQQQLQQVQNERKMLIYQMEATHPGYEWDEQHGFVQKEELEEVLT
jgi:hypothetical protein